SNYCYNNFCADSAEDDAFYANEGSVSFCSVSAAIPTSYKSLPENCESDNCISYDENKVKGKSTAATLLLKQHDIEILTQNDERIVSAPPNTQIDFVYFVHNGNAHPVTIRNIMINLSEFFRTGSSHLDPHLHHPEVGNFVNLGADGELNTITFNYTVDGELFERDFESMQKIILYDKTVQGLTETTPEVIYSFDMVQPVEITNSDISYEINNEEVAVTYKIGIKNVSPYTLDDIKIEIETNNDFADQVTYSLAPNEEKLITFNNTVELSSIDSNKVEASLAIIDPNSHMESAGAITTLYERTDADAPIGWYAWQASDQVHGWDNTALEHSKNKIELIPYTLHKTLSANIAVGETTVANCSEPCSANADCSEGLICDGGQCTTTQCADLPWDTCSITSGTTCNYCSSSTCTVNTKTSTITELPDTAENNSLVVILVSGLLLIVSVVNFKKVKRNV
ncbi:hypothetical protein KC660_03855, partial [Candidatus Dojkabacteria bacterium]|nr:hypothetical protein [Candidatus Dojkabacteria bacterium]